MASSRIFSGFFGLVDFGRSSRWITAESTFGFGLKCFAGTWNARVGFVYSWTWRERIECFFAQMRSATSFWTRRVVEVGGLFAVRKWVMSGEVM